MRVHEYQSKLWLPRPPKEIFHFFADAANLDAITPAWLHFRITTPQPVAMREGTLIDYNLRVRGLPLRWRTRINVWQPSHCFVDEQISGPYRLWIHEHRFDSCDGGTVVRDHVRYAVALDWLVHRWFVRRDIEQIFLFRAGALQRRFATDGAEVGWKH